MNETTKNILLGLLLLFLALVAVALDDSFEVRQPDPSYIPPYINQPTDR